MPDLREIAHPQMLWVNVNGPSGAARLYMFSGIAIFDWRGSGDDSWERGTLRIPLNHSFERPPRLVQAQVVDHVETASLASIYSRESGRRDAVGFAVESVYAFFPESPGPDASSEYGINVNLALRGNDDVRFYRVSFQLNVSARIEE